MPRSARSIPWLMLLACNAEIGDECSQNVDCSPQGDRICDLSQPGGYCTIEGCDEDTCPSEAICVRFFSAQALTLPCAKQDDCGTDAYCLSKGFCAPIASERRYCMRRCGTDGSCRDRYTCQRTGIGGAELAQDFATYDPDRVGLFCAPDPHAPPNE